MAHTMIITVAMAWTVPSSTKVSAPMAIACHRHNRDEISQAANAARDIPPAQRARNMCPIWGT
jgi:hypothetical protein